MQLFVRQERSSAVKNVFCGAFYFWMHLYIHVHKSLEISKMFLENLILLNNRDRGANWDIKQDVNMTKSVQTDRGFLK